MDKAVEEIKNQIASNKVLLYMKGDPDMPRCGFSAQAVNAVSRCGHPFAYVDVLLNPHIREALPSYAEWPTFPQLWVCGELVGGCDIIIELAETGELKSILDDAAVHSDEDSDQEAS